jgi:GntR family transcriptional repressor for pyruvate dehydrogenase complex
METMGTVTANRLKRATPQKPVYVRVVEQIQQLIRNGDLAPGDQLLSERELAESLGVSRTSVRKALAVLDGMGVIGVTPRDGAYVRRQSLEGAVEPLAQVLFQERENVSHLFEVRQMIETQAVRLAAARCDEIDLQRLRQLNQEFEKSLHSGDLAFQANTQFHLGIVKTAKNPILTEIMCTILTATMEVYVAVRHRSLSNITNLQQFVGEHERIINAMAEQEPDLAAKLLVKHIDDARQRAAEQIRV